MALFPTSIASFLGFTSSHTLSADQHAAQHNSEQAEIVAAETKIGTGPSVPSSGTVLRSNGPGTSAWSQVVLGTDVTGVLPLANGGTGSGTPSVALSNLGGATLQQVYPVGCIYTEVTGVNPNTTFGFGTWIAFAQGQVMIGNGTSDQTFNAGSAGGESFHKLITSEMPAHTHTTTLPANSTAGGTGNYFAGNNAGSLAAPSSSVGGDGTHNNLQPFIVVFIWRRTA